MPNLGGHNYYTFQRDNDTFKLSFGDCEYSGSRRFIDSLSNQNIEHLFDAIYSTIWKANTYAVQSKSYATYLLGQSSTQDFITITAAETSFWGLVPYQSVCLTTVSFHPFSCGDCRWNVEVEFGSATEFQYTNYDPAAAPTNTDNLPAI